jgi:hypothetical protein
LRRTITGSSPVFLKKQHKNIKLWQKVNYWK